MDKTEIDLRLAALDRAIDACNHPYVEHHATGLDEARIIAVAEKFYNFLLAESSHHTDKAPADDQS